MSLYLTPISFQNCNASQELSSEEPFSQLLSCKNPEYYSALQEEGVNLNAQDDDGNTVLMLKAQLRDHVIKLLELGADPWIQNKDGKVFLDFVKDFVESVVFVYRPSKVLLPADVRKYLVRTDEQFKKLMDFLEQAWVLGKKHMSAVDLLSYVLRTLPAHYVKALLEDRPKRFDGYKTTAFAFICWTSGFYELGAIDILAEKGFDSKLLKEKYTPLTYLSKKMPTFDTTTYVHRFLSVGVNPWCISDKMGKRFTILEILESKKEEKALDVTLKFMASQIKSYTYTPFTYEKEKGAIYGLPEKIMLQIFSYLSGNVSGPMTCRSWFALSRKIRSLKGINFKEASPGFPFVEQLERASKIVKNLFVQDQVMVMDFLWSSVKEHTISSIWKPFERKNVAVKIASLDPVFAYVFTKSIDHPQKKWALLYIAKEFALGGFDQKAREIAEEILKTKTSLVLYSDDQKKRLYVRLYKFSEFRPKLQCASKTLRGGPI